MPADLGEVGDSGFDGLMSELSGIDRLPALRGDQWYRTIREMTEQDATLGAILFAVEMMMRSAEWFSEPADDSDEAKAWSLFQTQAFDDMADPWSNTLADATSFLAYGYSLFELVYKQRLGITDDAATTSRYDDGLIGWRKWAFRPQSTKHRWVIRGGDVVGWEQRQPNYSTVTIPASKYQVFRSSARAANPDGVSLLKGVYRAYYNKKEIETQEAIGIGRDLAGLICFYVTDEIMRAESPDAKAARNMYTKMIQQVHRGRAEGLMLPSTFDGRGNRLIEAKLLTSGGARQFDTTRIIQRLDTAMAMRFLADYILVGHQQVGAYNVSESKIGNLEQAVNGWLNMMEENINEQACAELFNLNAVPMDVRPKWRHKDLNKPQIDVLAGALEKLVNLGLVAKTRKLALWIAETFNSPIPSEEELAKLEAEWGTPEPEPEPEPPMEEPMEEGGEPIGA